MRKMIIGLAPLLLAIGTGASAQSPGWKVSEVSGDVRLVENGRTRAATRGALLASGSTIATGTNARAVIVRGEEFVVISPRTQLRVPAVQSQNAIMQLIEDFGTAVFKIQKKSTPHFGVQTPYLAAVVKGTTFTVSVGPEGSSVQVTEGAVEVSTLDGGAKDLVRPGTIAQVGASDLYRLTVQGESTRVIHSEKGSAASALKSNAPVYSGPSARAIEVRARVAEKHDSVSDATHGLVEASSGHEMANAEFREQARAARRDGSNPGWGDGKDKPGKEGDKPAEDEKDKPAKDKPPKDENGDPGKDDKDKPAKDDKGDGKDVDQGGDKDADKGTDKGGDKDADKGGDKGGDKGSDQGGDKDADKGGAKDADKGGDKDADKGGEKDSDKDAGKDSGKDGGKGGAEGPGGR
ncbi:MAG TPA: FecR domain-containing protein [Allosphingosinicella sp.]|jgi:hypothetical protein